MTEIHKGWRWRYCVLCGTRVFGFIAAVCVRCRNNDTALEAEWKKHRPNPKSE